MKSNEKFQSLFYSFLLRNVYNSKFLWCIVFLLHERHVWTFYMNYIGLCCCLVHVLKECLNMFQNMRPGRTRSTKGS